MSAVSHRLVVALARYGMAAKATALRRHPEPRRLATLVATVRSLEAKAVDDVSLRRSVPPITHERLTIGNIHAT